MMRRRSIAFFMHDFSGGGVERMRLALASALTADGYQVAIIVVHAAGPLAHQVPAGVTVVDLACRRVSCAALKLRRYVRSARPDILVSSLDHNNIAALVACLGAGRSVRLVICQHNALSAELGLGWRYRIVPWLYWLLQHRADAILAVSEGVADDLAATSYLPRAAISVIYNPVIEPRRFSTPSVLPPHSWFSDHGCPVFVFAGRLVAQKDPLALVAAFAVRLYHGPAALIVLGDGPLRAAMEDAAERSGIRSRIFFAGFIAEPLPWIAHAHALLLTSRYEGFGNVIVEALACGTPVVAMDCPHGPAEILAYGKYGILVPPGDAVAFGIAMCGDLRARFPAGLLRVRAQDFTVDHAANRYVALFDQWPPNAGRRAFGLGFVRSNAADIAARMATESPGAAMLVVTPNVDHVRLLRNTAFRTAYGAADIVCADGWPVAFYAALRRAAPWRRVTGCDILHALIARDDTVRRRVLAVVESHHTARTLHQWLGARGFAGNWSITVAEREFAKGQAAQRALARAIAAIRPDIVLMTLGAPVSEIFIDSHRAMLPPCWALCAGQALRVEIGVTKRAPRVWRRLGLEWAWRCILEPWRLAPRYVRAAWWFPVAILLDLAGRRPRAG